MTRKTISITLDILIALGVWLAVLMLAVLVGVVMLHILVIAGFTVYHLLHP
jgi:hypothetical protein